MLKLLVSRVHAPHQVTWNLVAPVCDKNLHYRHVTGTDYGHILLNRACDMYP